MHNAYTIHKLTTCSRVIKKLTATKLVKKFLTFCGTQKFTTVFIKAWGWIILNQLNLICYLHPLSLRSILMLPSHLHVSQEVATLDLSWNTNYPAQVFCFPQANASVWLLPVQSFQVTEMQSSSHTSVLSNCCRYSIIKWHMIHLFYDWVFQVISSLKDFLSKFYMHFLFPHVCYTSCLSHSLSWSP